MDKELIKLAEHLGQTLRHKGLKLAIAESCSGGGICQVLTEIAGSSQWFECGFVCYSNTSKMRMLGVKTDTLKNFGAVSKQTAIEMVSGALRNSEADYAVSVTGIAGPEGGCVEKPVGTVFIALQSGDKCLCYEKHFEGTRHEVRRQAILFALKALQDLVVADFNC